jgi:anthranilate/para-aminobenzoate synthase component II
MRANSTRALMVAEPESNIEEGGCVLVVGGGRSYYRPFAKFGKYEDSYITILRGSKEEVQARVNLVLFTGGEDVYPALYGESANTRTRYSHNRDREECFAFMLARAYDLPMVGVCRGAQFLCAMAGGRLAQHVEHGSRHPVKLWDGRTVVMNSLHHQMQVPPASAKIIGWIDDPISKFHLDGDDKEIKMEKEAEVVYYPTIRAVGMQYHPEMMDSYSEGHRVAAEFLEKFLFNEEEAKAA